MVDYKAIAKEIISNGYLMAGVRGLTPDESYQVGDICRESYEWDYELDESMYDLHGEDGQTVGGTCAIAIERDYAAEYKDDWEDAEYLQKVADAIETAYEAAKPYGKDRIVVIAGHDTNDLYEADPGETRIVDAQVLAVIPC